MLVCPSGLHRGDVVARAATCSWWPSRWPAGATSPVATGAPGSTGRTPIKDLVDVHHPDADQIVLMQDNLNTHTPASLDAAFAPAEARRLADRATLEREAGAWQAARNRAGRGVNWRFTTEDARIKLKAPLPHNSGLTSY
jgi:hypothetical protein